MKPSFKRTPFQSIVQRQSVEAILAQKNNQDGSEPGKSTWRDTQSTLHEAIKKSKSNYLDNDKFNFCQTVKAPLVVVGNGLEKKKKNQKKKKCAHIQMVGKFNSSKQRMNTEAALLFSTSENIDMSPKKKQQKRLEMKESVEKSKKLALKVNDKYSFCAYPKSLKHKQAFKSVGRKQTEDVVGEIMENVHKKVATCGV